MAKVAQRYIEVDPWQLKEVGFHEHRAQVSESLFSLANEYMGVRGFLDEGYSGKKLIGTYFNGIYETPKDLQKSHYKGISDKQHYMVNSANIFYFRIRIGSELFEFNSDDISHFERTLDFRTGLYTRSYQIRDLIHITFNRILDMQDVEKSFQQIIIKPIKYSGPISCDMGLDLNVLHWNKAGFWHVESKGQRYILGSTTTQQYVFNTYDLKVNVAFEKTFSYKQKCNIETIDFNLENEAVIIEKSIVSLIDKVKKRTAKEYIKTAKEILKTASFNETLERNTLFYRDFWHKNDIVIHGDDVNQQGIRFCLFQLMQTYQGISETNNIGAKGLTGEAYSGHAFWDTETYCLPYYLFTNTKAAHHLLMFRYNTLNQARLRAKELDCRGACYPIATLNGDEACDLWQHASLQFQPTSAVAYAIWHYVKNTNDEQFLIDYGFEMLAETARFLSSRGQYNQTHTKFGYYGVMGPDEFQMMVNHNAYTNIMGKKSMTYFTEIYEKYKENPAIQHVIQRLNLKEEEIILMQDQCDKMYIPYDDETKIYEQHEGFHDLPHVDIHQIPVDQFPLYSHWSYDRIYRNDMIKQPDVLMFMFLYNQSYDLETKRRNYLYYEPKTIHESSLSPSIHSIFASELGLDAEALDFFGFATRMDIDDYNRNASEGLHMTSIAAAWVNIVYGFGGLRSDGRYLKIAPTLPKNWASYTFNLTYLGVHINVDVQKGYVDFTLDKALDQPIEVFEDLIRFEKGKTRIEYALR